MWWLFFPVAMAEELPEFRTCGAEYAVAETVAEAYYDDLCGVKNGPQQVFSQVAPELISAFNRRISATDLTLKNEDFTRPNVLTDTQKSPHQMAQIVTEDLLEFDFCARQLCQTVTDMCAVTAPQNRADSVQFRLDCPAIVDELVQVQKAKAETALVINAQIVKAQQRTLWALQRLRQLTTAWVTGPMADLLGDMQDFTTNTTGLIQSPKK